MSFSVLFVDDDPFILSGLKRLLRSRRVDWNVDFASSGLEALQLMRVCPRDVVVTDMRMPGMDGGTLLNHVRAEFPRSIRFVLSGQSTQEAAFRALGPAHQYLCKPCDLETLEQTIRRATALRDSFEDPELVSFVSQIDCLPSLPEIYEQLLSELQASDLSMTRVGEIIKQDLAMSARILQLVNSSFFGLPQRMTDPVQAVAWLGANHVRPLVLTAGLFSRLEGSTINGFSLGSLLDHSLAVGTCARMIAEDSGQTAQDIEDAFLAGMLHDIGKLVFASKLPVRFQHALQTARTTDMTLWEAERQEFGATHATVGAYLLSLWGLPNSVTEAIAFHHEPKRCLFEEFTPLYAVHVANALQNAEFPMEESVASLAIDTDYLNSVQCRGVKNMFLQTAVEN